MVKGGAALPNELMIRTRFGSAADPMLTKSDESSASGGRKEQKELHAPQLS